MVSAKSSSSLHVLIGHCITSITGKTMRSHIFKFFVLVAVAACSIQTLHAQRIRAVRDPDSAGILSIKVAKDLPDGDLAERIEKDRHGKSTLAESPDKIRQA